MFNMAMSGQRDENPYVNQQQVQQDVEALYRAGQGKIGTVSRLSEFILHLADQQDEIGVCGILLSRSDAHLQAIAQAFPQRHRKSLSQMYVTSHVEHMTMLTSQGRLRVLGTYARRSFLPCQDVRERRTRNSEGCRVSRSCHVGYGDQGRATVGYISHITNSRLTGRIYRLLRCHWNRPKFASIKSQYQTRYRTTLRKRVEGETTGKYENALVAIIEQS